MSSDQDQQQNFEQLKAIYRQIKQSEMSLDESLSLLQEAQKIYKVFVSQHKQSDLIMHQVNQSVKNLSEDSLEGLEYDWEKFY